MTAAFPRVSIIGAGPSGLAACKTLSEFGLPYDCFEMSSEVGGNWVLKNPNGRSACYASLYTNTSKAISRFSDFTMPDDWPDFPHRTQRRQWFNAYVDHFGFHDHILVGTAQLKLLSSRLVFLLSWPDGIRLSTSQKPMLAESRKVWGARWCNVPLEDPYQAFESRTLSRLARMVMGLPLLRDRV